jgi:plasmid maintenance system antidote protein VapI
MIDFGACLQKAQIEKNVTSAQLARMLGVQRQQITIWRKNKNCRLDTAMKICSVLGLGLEEFVSL